MSGFMPSGQGHNVQYFPISANAIGADTTIIPADVGVAGERGPRKFKVFTLVLLAKAATIVTLKSGATAISGPMSFALGSGISSVGAPSAPMFEIAAGQAFNINTSADGVYGWCGVTIDS